MHISPTIKSRFTQIEFWGLTSVFSIGLLFFTWQSLGSPDSGEGRALQREFSEWGIQFGYYKHYFIPVVLRFLTYFVCFMYLNFRLLPNIIENGFTWNSLLLILPGFSIILGMNVASDFYLHAYLMKSLGNEDKAVAYIWQSNLIYSLWLCFAFATYTLVKYGGLLLLSYFEIHTPKVAYLRQTPLITWLMIVLIGLVLSFFSNPAISLLWLTILPVLSVFYYLGYYRFIPFALTKKRTKLVYAFLVIAYSILSWMFIAAIVMGIANREYPGMLAAVSTSFFLAIIAAPALWVWFHYQQKRKENVQVLEQKLGQSTAQLDHLRTQINPHFLFNALNTVYGLALTEKADSTADAIEKISEMMRFMLRENQEASIPLHKDLEYLSNYISIQKMRLAHSHDIDLQFDIPESIDPALSIAPMILIPFVENAFKHGISLQSPSFIRLVITLEENQLFFTLQNSTHDRHWLNDPEEKNHGIGLQNVQQRLALLYPQKHILEAKELPDQYKVALTLLLQ